MPYPEQPDRFWRAGMEHQTLLVGVTNGYVVEPTRSRKRNLSISPFLQTDADLEQCGLPG
jgi:hypothetical protein